MKTEMTYDQFNSADWSKNVTAITAWPDGITSIGNAAFWGCSGLTSITLPASLTRIGYGAFVGCAGLTSITLPDSLTRIGYAAFAGCSGLTSLTLPDSLDHIGDDAFWGCAGLTALTLHGYPVLTTSRGFTAYFAGGQLVIGCERHTVEWWLQNVGKIAAKHELAPSEKEELSKIIEMYEN